MSYSRVRSGPVEPVGVERRRGAVTGSPENPVARHLTDPAGGRTHESTDARRPLVARRDIGDPAEGMCHGRIDR